ATPSRRWIDIRRRSTGREALRLPTTPPTPGSQTPCALGLDFGTASVRAVVVETHTGRERGAAVVEYPHGVIDMALPGTGEKLPGDWALQHPGDWVSSIEKAVPQALAAAGVPKEAIVGIGVDFTACTVLPVDVAGEPLCLSPFW